MDEFRRGPEIKDIFISPVFFVGAVDHGSGGRTRDQEPFCGIDDFGFAQFNFQREFCRIILPEPESEGNGEGFFQIRIFIVFHLFASEDKLFRQGISILSTPSGKEVPPATGVDAHENFDFL